MIKAVDRKILFLDDEIDWLVGYTEHFRQSQWKVFLAETAEQAKEQMLANQVNVAVLDVNLLPSYLIEKMKSELKDLGKETFVKQEGEGFRVASWIRERLPKTGVIMLSSERTDPLDRISGLDCGADDYVSKKISPEELFSRVMALMRRIYPESKVIPIGELTLLVDRGALFDGNGKYIVLTASEQKLLLALADIPVRSRSRAELYSALFDVHLPSPSDRAVDNIISKLRSKVRAELKCELSVETIYGGGYRLK